MARRALGVILAGALVLMAWQLPVAEAAMIATAALFDTPRESDAAALAARLTALGVPPAAAQARVARLTAAERATLAARLDQLSAGGDVIGALAFVALILLLTDILGYTDVYPFVTRTLNAAPPTATPERPAATGECVPAASAAAPP